MMEKICARCRRTNMPPSKDAAVASFTGIKMQPLHLLPWDKNASNIFNGLPVLDHVCTVM